MTGKDYNIVKRYNLEIYKQMTIVAPALSLCSAVILTIFKICGYFPETSLAGAILFDVLCALYLALGLLVRFLGLSKDSMQEKMMKIIKYAVTILSILHWNMITYIYPFSEFWAYEPLFVLVVASFFDTDLLLKDMAGLTLSIIIASLLGKGGFIPPMTQFYNFEVILRWVALILINIVIHSLTKYTQVLIYQVSEQIENLNMLRKAGAIDTVKAKSIRNDGRKLLDGIIVLLVDDNELTRDINKDILEAEGATVMEASSGESAIHKFKEDYAFDAILMDLIMPGMGGIEAIRRIRTLEEDRKMRIPIVAISGEASESTMKEAITAGADDALPKPLDVKAFSRILITSLKDKSTLTQIQLQQVKKTADTDALTHVKSISAYTDKVTEISNNMDTLYPNGFAVVMCDINGLKKTNDTLGHDAGDQYIKNNCRIICEVFNHSPVFRIGGDEFVVILEGMSYINRKQLFNDLLVRVDKAEHIQTIEAGKASLAAGMASYKPGKDMTFGEVLKRADVEMYARKKAMKASSNQE